VRDTMVSHLETLQNDEDFAVRDRAVGLAQAWGQLARWKSAALPTGYSLAMPPLAAQPFEPPSGISSTNAGLWTGDLSGWTWPLEHALNLASDASGLNIAVLQARAARKM